MRSAISRRFPNLTAMDVRKAAALAETVARANRGQTALGAPQAISGCGALTRPTVRYRREDHLGSRVKIHVSRTKHACDAEDFLA
jgi:hypothetical protein